MRWLGCELKKKEMKIESKRNIQPGAGTVKELFTWFVFYCRLFIKHETSYISNWLYGKFTVLSGIKRGRFCCLIRIIKDDKQHAQTPTLLLGGGLNLIRTLYLHKKIVGLHILTPAIIRNKCFVASFCFAEKKVRWFFCRDYHKINIVLPTTGAVFVQHALFTYSFRLSRLRYQHQANEQRSWAIFCNHAFLGVIWKEDS